MVLINVLFAIAGVFQTVVSQDITVNGIVVPKLKSDFKKGDQPAEWAKGYPKQWGSEDFRYQLNDPIPPERYFQGLITEDEKYLVMFNASHASFMDLGTNLTVSTFALDTPPGYTDGFAVLSAPQGGYDLFRSIVASEAPNTEKTLRMHISSDALRIGEPTSVIGRMGTFDKNGRLSTTNGRIYNFDSPDSYVTLQNASNVYRASFSGDGQYLSASNYQDGSVILWNTTSGERIPLSSWATTHPVATQISPDNKYIADIVDTGDVLIHSLTNLTSEPKLVGNIRYNLLSFAIAWSPNGHYLAVNDRGRMRVWKFPEAELVQTWEVEKPSDGGNGNWPEIYWLDGGNKVSWTYRYGRAMYDFDSNLKWWWTPGPWDHSWDDGTVYFFKKGGYQVTVDGDSVVRFWRA